MSRTRTESPLPLLIIGVFIFLIGCGFTVLVADAGGEPAPLFIGFVTTFLGGVMTLIACIAAGVEWGVGRTL